MKTNSTTMKFLKLSAMIATAGTAVAVGVLFAQSRTDPTLSRRAVSTNGPTHSADRVPSISDKPTSPIIQAYTDGVAIAYPTQPSSSGFSSEGGPVDRRDNRYGPNSSMVPQTAQFQGTPGQPNPYPNPQFPPALSGQPGTYIAPQSPPTNTTYPTYNPYPPAMRPATPEEIKIGQLVAELHGLPGEHHLRKQKESELRSLIAAQFETRHQQQSDQVEKLSADVKRMQDILQRRDHQRDEIIERRLSELTGHKDPLQWDYQPLELPANSVYGVVPSSKMRQPFRQPDFENYRSPQLVPGKTPDFPASNELGFDKPAISEPLAEPDNDLQGEPELDRPSDMTRNPSASEFTPDALMGAMRRLKSLKEELARVEDSGYATADARAHILAELKPKVAEATEEWEFAQQQLVHHLKLQELAMEDARATEELAKSESEHAKQAYQEGTLNLAEARRANAASQHASNSLQRIKLKLDRLRDLHQRAEAVQKQWNAGNPPNTVRPGANIGPEVAPKPVAPVEKVEGVEPPPSTRS